MKINCNQSEFNKVWVSSCVDAHGDLCLALEDQEAYVSVYLTPEEVAILQKHLAEVLKANETDISS